MGDRRGKGHHVEHGAAADDDDARLTVQADVVKELEQPEWMAQIVLARFTAGNEHRGHDELQRVSMSIEVAPNRRRQANLRAGNLVVEDDENAVATVRLQPTDNV
jgi:hypothetical protein